MRFKEKLYRFFSGRYGIDELNTFLFWTYLITSLILSLFEFFFKSWILFFLRMTLSVIAIYLVFRILSRSIYKRQNENRKFLFIRHTLQNWFHLQKNKFRDRKTHVYRKCPFCQSVLRLKKIKGSHRAVCPRCTKSFDVTIR